MNDKEKDQKKILKLVEEFYEKYHKKDNKYVKGDKISYASRMYDSKEMLNLVDSSLEFWLTSGRYTKKFEMEFAKKFGVKYCLLVNSGSSANLLAFMTLTSPLLNERRILPGDEIITVACGFPTTISPIIQYGAIPVFVDITIPEYNIDVSMLDKALSNKTKAVMVAHTLGNPFNIEKIKDFCLKNNLWLIEDNCDALGSEYLIDGKVIYTGTCGDIATSSFYPPHHMTMGEGGAVYTNNPLLRKIALSFRDWGRDCCCTSGMDNMCGHRFDGQYGELPFGYDHKYVYSHFGYNLKATDLQAAIGCAQLEKITDFISKRRNNFQMLYDLLKGKEDKIILPKATNNSYPSWFGFLITCKSGIDRSSIVRYVEDKGIQTRMLFAGNIIKHPCFDEMRKNNIGFRVVGDLNNTDIVMNNSFWVGVYPGMTKEMIEYMADIIIEALDCR